MSEVKKACDPVGTYNDVSLLENHQRAEKTIAIWGNAGTFKGRADEVTTLLPGLLCLQLTVQKQPRSIKGISNDILPIAL